MQYYSSNGLSRYVAIIATCILLHGCAVRSLYIPVSQNVPLFDSNKQIRGCAYLGTNHIELQAAYNPSKHAALATNINFGGGIAIYDVAAGLFTYNLAQRLRYEIFAGYGYNSNIIFPATYSNIFTKERIDYEINSLYNKYYLQPAIGYFGEIKMYKLHYSFSLSSRLSYLKFKRFLYREIDASKTVDPDDPVYKLTRSYRNKDLFLIEPCITNKVGMGKISAIIQLQGMIPYSDEIDLRDTKFSPGVLLSLGIQYNISLKPKK